MIAWKYLLAAIFMLVSIPDGRSLTLADCAAEAPHHFYHPSGREPGAVIFSIMFLPPTLAIGVATLGQNKAICMPLMLATHAVYVGGKPH